MKRAIVSVGLLLLVASCYRGPYQAMFTGKGQYEDVGNCLYEKQGGEEAEMYDTRGNIVNRLIMRKYPEKRRYEIGVKVLHNDSDLNGRLVVETANWVTVLQDATDNILVIVEHAPDWSFVWQTDLSSLLNDYVPDCLENAKMVRSR